MSIDLMIEPVRRVTLVDSVVQRVRDVIEQSGLKPGDRLLGELELAKQLDVSRSVVREAISRLQSIGLVAVVRGRNGGTFVGDQDTVLSYAKVVRSAMSVCDKDTKQLAEFRAALEIFSARLAAEVATDADADDLDQLCGRIGDSGGDDETAASADFQFHRKLAEIAGNEIILHTLVLSREFIKSTIRDTGPRDPQRSQLQHQAIANAIRNHDAAAAEQAMRLHMDSVIGDLLLKEVT